MASRFIWVLCFALTVAGCGTNALNRHYTGALISRVVIDEAAVLGESSCEQRAEQAAQNAATAEEAEARVDEIERVCDRVALYQHGVVSSWKVWVTYLHDASTNEGERFTVARSRTYIRSMIGLYNDFATLLREELGVENVPELPEALVALLGGT